MQHWHCWGVVSSRTLCRMSEGSLLPSDVRQRAVCAVLEGMPKLDVAAAFAINRTTLFRWLQRYKAEGESGLHRKTGSGRRRKLEELSEEELRSLVLKGALHFGYETDLWTVRRLRRVITEEFSVTVHWFKTGRALFLVNLLRSGHGWQGSNHRRVSGVGCQASSSARAAGVAHYRSVITVGQGVEEFVQLVEIAVERYREAAEEENRSPQEGQTGRTERTQAKATRTAATRTCRRRDFLRDPRRRYSQTPAYANRPICDRPACRTTRFTNPRYRTSASKVSEQRGPDILAPRTGTPKPTDLWTAHAVDDRLAQVTGPLQRLDHCDLDG